MPDSPDTRRILLDTLGKLRAHGHGLFGCCLDCGEISKRELRRWCMT